MKAGGNMSVIHLRVPGEWCSFSLDHLEQNRSTHVNSNGKYYSILNSSERDRLEEPWNDWWVNRNSIWEENQFVQHSEDSRGSKNIWGKQLKLKLFSIFSFWLLFRFTKVSLLLNSCKIDLILTSTCKALHQSGVVRLLVRNWWKSGFSPPSAQKENRLVSIKPEILSHMISSLEILS